MYLNSTLIGQELKSLRTKRNKTIEEVSNDLDIHYNTLSKYEKDASDMQLGLLEKILEYFEIDHFFTVIGGATLDGKTVEKEDVIALVLQDLKADKKDVVMVGDTRFDLIGAEKMGLDAVGVTYGFGEKEELVTYKHIAIIDDIRQLVDVI